MTPANASAEVANVRGALSRTGGQGLTTVRSDGARVHHDASPVDLRFAQSAFEQVIPYVNTFNLIDPVDDISNDAEWWGPNLLWPSKETAISPWVMAGDPCVRATRVPTSTLFAIHRERRLTPAQIGRFFPSLTEEQIGGAINLETKLLAA